MKAKQLLLTLLLSTLLSIQSASAITADELSRFLGVANWRTVVALPGKSFTVQVFEFANGVVSNHTLIGSEPEWTKNPEAGATILVGPQDGKYKVMVIFPSGDSITAATQTPVFSTTVSSHLPEQIQEGDFIFFGERLAGESYHGSNDVRSYSKGFLVRVKKI